MAARPASWRWSDRQGGFARASFFFTGMNHMNLSFEQLENRLLMAAKVTVTDTTATIKGTSGNETIQINGIDTNSFEIFVDSHDGNGFVSLGITHGCDNIRIRGNGGQDQIFLNGVVLQGFVDIKGGSDTDFVGAEGCQFKSLRINTYGGDDNVQLVGNIIHRNTNIKTGDGADFVGLFGNNQFLDDLRISTGEGQDEVQVVGNTMIQRTFIRTDGGNGDFVHFCQNTVGDNVKCNGGKGTDDLLESDMPGVLRDARKFEHLDECFDGGEGQTPT